MISLTLFPGPVYVIVEHYMKWLIIIAAGLLLVIGIMLIALSMASREQPALGVQNGQLKPCPSTPNCVCSEYPADAAYIEPFSYTLPAKEAWAGIKYVIKDSGGRVIAEQTDYLRAEYTTTLLRFIDDIEFRLDRDHQLIHVRSASRVGRSDLGANRQRVEQLRTRFNNILTKVGETP